MPDYIGDIEVPEVSISGTAFPLVSDYGAAATIAPEIAIHQFGSGNAKIEQRFVLGTGARRWTVVRADMDDSEVEALRAFWESRKSAYQPFPYTTPDGESVTVTFDTEPLTFDRLVGAVNSAQCTLVEYPTTGVTYSLSSTVTRFPSFAFALATVSQAQRVVPLVKIQPLETGYPAIYLSDRRCTIGEQLYQARLLDWDGISQSLGNESDQATFTFGNADRVMRELANDVDLTAATVEFSLFHATALIKLDLWKGAITSWDMDSGPEFRVTASDGIYEITLPYPPRKISRTCPKWYNDGTTCPFTAEGGLDLVHFPSASDASCDRGYDSANGCQAHGMSRYFGGVVAKPQGVRITDNGSGTIFRLGRSMVTATSLVADSIYGRPLKEVYTDIPMPVNCDIAAGRDESDFYAALGIVGEGPLGSYGTGHKLDGQYHHGYPGPLGLRTVLGNDPATGGVDPVAGDTHFSLGQSGNQVADWTKEYVGASTYEKIFAAGTAFIELRRSDEKGIQLTGLDTHQMQAVIQQGISGWMWTDASTRVWGPLYNPVWIAVNALLRARGLRNASAATQVQYFDVEAAMVAAAICTASVPSLIDGTNETQFAFRGVIEQEKPLRDWIQEILANCLGYYTFSFGKLRIGLRINSSAASAFTAGNMLWNSLKLSTVSPAFNQLTTTFADSEFDFVANSVSVQADEHAALRGGGAGPLWLKGSLNLSGTSTKSQAGRITAVRLREELGGTTPTEWRKARVATWSTTIIGLDVEPGMVVSITDADVPGGLGEFRVTGWRLNRDYSIDLQGRTTTDSMYDLVDGPKPADVEAEPVAPELFPSPNRPVWHPNAEAPAANDPMFETTDKTFGLAQEYTALADGTAQCSLVVTGALPVNDFIPGAAAPVVRTYSAEGSGGLHFGERSVWVAICARDANGNHSPHSNIIAIRTPAGDDNKIVLTDIDWPVGTWAGYTIFGAYDDARLLCMQEEQVGALPATIEWIGPAARSTYGMPSTRPRYVRVKAKPILHSGVAFGIVSAVGASTITCANLAGLADDWTNRDVSVISDATDGSAALWNHNATAYNPATGQFTVTPTVSGIEAGDVLIIRTLPSSFSSTTIGDSKFVNGLYPGGISNDESGYAIRIIAGTGRGQVRRITSHTTTVYTVDQPFDVTPDATSRFIVEDADWRYFAESSPQKTRGAGNQVRIAISADNFLGRTMLVGGFVIDVNDQESPEEFSPVREIYLYGDGGSTGGSNVDVPDVTDVTAGYPISIPTEDGWGHSVPVSFHAPDPRGTGAAEFSAYEPHYQIGAGEGVSLGVRSFAGAAGELVSLDAIIPYQFESCDVTIYIASRSATAADSLSLASTPHATVAYTALQTPPDVRRFRAGTLDPDTNTYTAVMRWDTLGEKLMIDWEFILPTIRANWEGAAVWIRTPLLEQQATGKVSDGIPVNDSGSLTTPKYWRDAIAIELSDVPDPVEEWEFIAVSYDRFGQPNRDEFGAVTGPTIALMTLPPAAVVFAPPGPVQNVTHADPEFTAQSPDAKIRIKVSYDPPATLNGFDRLPVWVEAPDQSASGTALVVGDVLAADAVAVGEWAPQVVGTFPHVAGKPIIIELPQPNWPSESWRLYIGSANALAQAALVRAGESGATPSFAVTVTQWSPGAVTGEEDAPLIESPFTIRNTTTLLDGKTKRVAEFGFTEPTDTRYGGVTIELVDQDGTLITTRDYGRGQVTAVGGAVVAWDEPTTSRTWRYRFRSYSAARTNAFVSGVTPEISLTVGTTGGVLDWRQGIAASYNTSEFHVDPVTGKWSMNGVDFSKGFGGFDVGDAVPKITIKDALDNIIGWIGDDTGVSGYIGAWFKRMTIGGSSPATAKIVADSSGNVTIDGSLLVGTLGASVIFTGKVQVAVAGITVTIDPADSAAPFKVVNTAFSRYCYCQGTIYSIVSSTDVTRHASLGLTGLITQSGGGSSAGSSLVNGALTLNGGSPGQSIGIDATITYTASTASAGGRALPSNPADFLIVYINGVAKKVPFYNS